ARPTCFVSWAEISFARSFLSTDTLLPAAKEHAAAVATAAAAHSTEPKSRRIAGTSLLRMFAEHSATRCPRLGRLSRDRRSADRHQRERAVSRSAGRVHTPRRPPHNLRP